MKGYRGLPEPGGVFIGRDFYRRGLVNLPREARITHAHVVGASNRGKSNALSVMIRQDLLALDGMPRGVTVIDPHGSMVDSTVEWIAQHRLQKHRKVRVIDPSDGRFAFSFNPFRALSHFDLATLVDLLVNCTIQIWGGAAITASPQIAEVLGELYTALGSLELNIADANDFLLRDREKIRRRHLERLEEINPDAHAWWCDLERLPVGRRDEYLSPVRRRLRLFLGSVFVRRIFSQQSRALDLAQEMDRGSILLVNLKPGPNLSADAARLLGALLVNEFYTSVFRRKREGLQHYLYLDECQLFLTPDIARILDQARKFKLSMVLSHQHLGHLREAGEHIFRSVMTNCNTKIVFGGLDPDDAEYMARLMFRGEFDLQRSKRRLFKPQVVGQQKVLLEQESATASQTHATGRNWSQGSAATKSTARTKNVSLTKGTSHTDSESHTSSWAQSHTDSQSTATVDMTSEGESASSGMVSVPGEGSVMDALMLSGPQTVSYSDSTGTSASHTTGTVSTQGSSNTSTIGGSRSVGTADGSSTARTRGRAMSEGTAVTSSTQEGGSSAIATGSASTRGRGEAFAPIYRNLHTDVWSLEEQIHTKSVALAHVPQGQAWMRAGSQRPRRIVVPYVGGAIVLPERVERVRRELLEKTPYVASAALVDQEYLAYRARLLEEAVPREPDHDIELTAEAIDTTSEAPETIPVAKLLEWK